MNVKPCVSTVAQVGMLYTNYMWYYLVYASARPTRRPGGRRVQDNFNAGIQHWLVRFSVVFL